MSEPVAIKNISVSVSGDDTDESTAAEALISVHRGAMMSGDTPGPSSPSKTNTRSKGLLSGTFSFFSPYFSEAQLCLNRWSDID